jgi:hypothetical protein
MHQFGYGQIEAFGQDVDRRAGSVCGFNAPVRYA